MLTIHGVPLSVHTRKTIVTAILKDMDYTVKPVIPVIPDNPPPDWGTLSPTGLIPVLEDGAFTLADSTAICLYMEKKQPTPSILPSDAEGYGRTLWFDAYAGGTIFRHVVHPLFVQTVVNPKIRRIPSDKAVIDTVLNAVQPKIFAYLDAQIGGTFLVGNTMTLADIAIVSNFIVYQYMGYRIDTAAYPKLAAYLKQIAATDTYAKALEHEKPFVANMGLDHSFLE
ncbi:MAG TPA: glutathione S-transferase family protein [Vineibacter sp.]|nr:glutathione S-transferase family protein [Vineibacter sp.]